MFRSILNSQIGIQIIMQVIVLGPRLQFKWVVPVLLQQTGHSNSEWVAFVVFISSVKITSFER